MKIFRYLKIALFTAFAVFAVACSAQLQPQPDNTGALELTDNAIQQLDSHISAIVLDDLLNSHKLEHFRQAGIDVSVENIHKLNNDSISFDLILKKGLKKLEIPVNALLHYRAFSNGDKIIDIDVYWGNLTVNDDEIVFTSLDDIKIWSADGFEPVEKTFDFSFLPGADRYFVDAIKDKNGYTIAYYSPGEQGIALMDREGGFEKKYTLKQKSPYIYFGEKSDETEFNQNFHLTLKNCLFYLDHQQQTLAIINKDSEVRDGYIFDMAADTVYRADEVFSFAQGDTGCIVLSRTGISAYPQSKAISDYMAVRIKNHHPANSFIFDDIDIDPGFGYDNETGRRDLLNFSHQGELHTVTAYCRQTMQTVEIDFTNKTARAFYSDTDPSWPVMATSADGKFSIVKGEDSGVADASSYSIFLRENPTGKTKYLCHTGRAQTGFYENNDPWVLTDEDLLVFSSDIGDENVKYKLSDRIAFGKDTDDGMAQRLLLYAIRNPTTKVYTVVYTENTTGKEEYISPDSFQLVDTYKIARIDSAGNIIMTADTGVNAVFTPMGYEGVKLRMETGDKLVMYAYHPSLNTDTMEYEETVCLSGWLDITTGEYNEIQPFTWPSV